MHTHIYIYMNRKLLDHILLYQLKNVQKLMLDEIEGCNMIVFILI